jgi:ATP-dependent DNA ligase
MSGVAKRSASQTVKPGRSRRDVPLPQFVAPQLSRPVEKPPSGPQWVHEIKLDGYRMAARIDNGRVQLLTRTGLDWTAKYPSAIAALANLNVKTAYVDGELCGVDEAGLPSFAQTQAATDSERDVQLVFYAFDLLHLDGRDVSRLPLIERKALLEPLVAIKPGLQFNGHDTGDGELILKHAGKLGFEGVVSKTIDAAYAQETVASGVKPKRSTAKSSSSLDGSTRKDRDPISGRYCSATTTRTASSPAPAGWARECRSRCSPICDAGSTR